MVYRVGGAYSSDDGLLLFLKVLVEFSASPVVPDEVRVLCVTVQDLQQLQSQVINHMIIT